MSDSAELSIVKRPLFITTVPRGVFLPPQPIVREIVATKPRHIYAFASHPRILDQTNHLYPHQQQQRRRDFLTKQNSINNTFNQFLHKNFVSKNIRSFDELIEVRLSHDIRDGGGEKNESGGIAGVKIARTR